MHSLPSFSINSNCLQRSHYLVNQTLAIPFSFLWKTRTLTDLRAGENPSTLKIRLAHYNTETRSDCIIGEKMHLGHTTTAEDPRHRKW